jgi:hypothetical protein
MEDNTPTNPPTKTRRKLGRKNAKMAAHPKTIDDPVLNRSVPISPVILDPTADTRALTKQVNALTNTTLALTATVSQYRQMFADERKSKEVNLDVVYCMAAAGCDKGTIGELLGISIDLLVKRQDLVEAFASGRAQLKRALFSRQVETAMANGKDSVAMQIFLGKQILGQKPDAALTQVNLQVNVDAGGGDLRTKIAEEQRRIREEAAREFANVIDAEVVDVGTEPQKSQ